MGLGWAGLLAGGLAEAVGRRAVRDGGGLLERDDVVASAAELVGRVRSGGAGALFLVGEAGLGKTGIPGMIIHSPYDDVEFAPVPLHDFVLEGAASRGDRPALIDGPTGRVLTYAELADSAREAAAGLVARGAATGDTLALCGPNSPAP
jgi:hypothetical protein